jgi:hypothetical protein
MGRGVITMADLARTQLGKVHQSQELMQAARIVEAAAYGLAGDMTAARVSQLILMSAELERFAQALTATDNPASIARRPEIG